MTQLAPTLLAPSWSRRSALRMAPGRIPDGPARDAFELAAAVLDDRTDDRPLGDDLERARGAAPGLAEGLPDGGGPA